MRIIKRGDSYYVVARVEVDYRAGTVFARIERYDSAEAIEDGETPAEAGNYPLPAAVAERVLANAVGTKFADGVLAAVIG